MAAAEGEELPAGWAFDATGQPTRDAMVALEGMLAPMAGAKGWAIALMVEALTGGVVGPHLATEIADPFSPTDAGHPQGIAHLLLAIDPATLDVDGRWQERLDQLCGEIVSAGDGFRVTATHFPKRSLPISRSSSPTQ